MIRLVQVALSCSASMTNRILAHFIEPLGPRCERLTRTRGWSIWETRTSKELQPSQAQNYGGQVRKIPSVYLGLCPMAGEA
jgi:hypothetical protein